MSFDISTIAILCGFALLFILLVPQKVRGWVLFGGSVLAIYWYQTATPVRFGDYLLQTTTILLTVMTWWLTRDRSDETQHAFWKEDRISLLVLFGLILFVALNRYLGFEARWIGYRPPSVFAVAAGLLAMTAVFTLLSAWLNKIEQRKVLTAGIVFIVIIFVILKSPQLTTAVSAFWRSLTGQQANLASPSDLIWIGFSYVAFRLISTLRDKQTGQLPIMSLREFMTYTLFFPAYIAGPIDRAERFIPDLREGGGVKSLLQVVWGKWQAKTVNNQQSTVNSQQSPISNLQSPDAHSSSLVPIALYRILVGMFKKFVIADSLALGMSLTAVNIQQADSTIMVWVLLYGYALRLFFDFAGYTDIAIGIGMLFGITLPENFKRPYLKTNITSFWQSWHITLSNWVRFYVFSPLSRSLLRRKPRPSTDLILFISHMTTMIIIGLWHGITINFFIWGLWHGLALFIHKMWSDRTRKWYRGLKDKRWQFRTWTAVTWFLTFNYVALGWVWFMMPTIQLSLLTFGKLLGLE